MLVLDLRPWKSFDNVSNVNESQHDNNDHLEVNKAPKVFIDWLNICSDFESVSS